MLKQRHNVLVAASAFLCFLAQPTLAQSYVPDWMKTFPPPLGHDSTATALAQAPDGNIVVAGSLDDQNGEPDYLAIKYNASGDIMWKTTHASAMRKNNSLADIAFDPVGNILLTGNSDTVKLDALGNRVWSTPFSGRSLAVNSRYSYLVAPTVSGYAAIQIGNEVPAPVDVILDCDPGGDADDMSDLAIVNNLMSRGEVNLIGIMGSHRGPWISISIDIMKRYYGHPNIPVGVAQDGPEIPETYGWYMRERYGSTIGYDSGHPDSVALYRSILASRPDRSVTIVFTGQLRNLLSLWNSQPDAASPLFGPALLAKKVRQLLIVGGVFPDSWGGAEYNMMTDIEGAQVLNRLTDNVSVTYVGIELGDEIKIPINGVAVMDAQNPVRYAHELFGATNRPSWSGLALLVAARGLGWNGNTYFTSVPGRAVVRPNGANLFVEDKNANHRYLRKTQPDNRYIDVLDDLLLMPPPGAPQSPAGDQTGHEIWTRQLNVRAHDEANFIRVNDFGEIFAGGVEARAGDFETTPARFALTKFGEAGSVRWRTGSTNEIKPQRSATTLRNMAVVGGSIWLFGQYGPGSALFKFSSSGEQLWHLNFPAGIAQQMVVSAAGTSYVANTIADRLVITRVGSDGVTTAEAAYKHDFYDTIGIEAAALDGSGFVYFAGGLKSADKSEIFLIRFNQDLTQRSVMTYPGRYAGDARAKALAIRDSGDVYLTGHMRNAEGNSELFTLKLTPAFQMQKTENTLRLQYRVAPNQPLTLEATHDFSNWEHVATKRADQRGVVQFEDTNVLNLPTRFYRTKAD